MDDALSLPAVAAFKEKETEGTDQKTLGLPHRHFLLMKTQGSRAALFHSLLLDRRAGPRDRCFHKEDALGS